MATARKRTRPTTIVQVLPQPAMPPPVQLVPDIPEIKPITVMLDRERQIIFDLNALIFIEQEFGIDTTQAGALNLKGLSDLRRFLWVGLRHDDPDLTEEQVGHLVTMQNLGAVGLAVRVGLGMALPPPEAAAPISAAPEDGAPGEADAAASTG